MRIIAVLIAVCSLGLSGGITPAEPPERPKLVVFVIVDQLRGDMLPHIHGRLGEGGFRRFLDGGLFYANAEYQHSTTFTAVGHASLATGGNAPEHGIVGNQWYSPETGGFMYCVADDEHRYVGVEGTPPNAGTSPRNLLSSTLADEVVLESGGQGRAFAVSLKDRAAILSAGRLGKGFWFEKTSGRFISSTFYYDALPEWAERWNAAEPAKRYREQVWDLLLPRESYTFGAQDNRNHETGYKALGNTFPHDLKQVPPDFLYSALYYTPFGDRLTADFAMRLVVEEKLGQGIHPDLLTVGFSAQDYIGHAYGPNSLEAEDNLLQLDATLARFFQFLDVQVGRENVLLALSSDHGIHDIPEYLAEKGFPGGRIVPEDMLAHAEATLQKQFNTQETLLAGFENPCLYLNLDAIRRLGLNQKEVEDSLAQAMRTYPGIALAIGALDIAANRMPDIPVYKKIARSYHPQRSGHVFIVEKPFWYLYYDARAFAAMHGSPYPYDTHVPVAFSGMGVPARWIWDTAAPESVAPTLAAFLRIKRPSGATAPLLVEALAR